jgi:hypothetical protein
MRRTGLAARMGGKRTGYNIFVGKCEGKWPYERPLF